MRILLIEDHQDIAANIAEYFGGKGDTVSVANNGIDGLAMARAHRTGNNAGPTDAAYDAIVLDLMLPGLDGLSVCRELRADGAVRTPILMLTARDLLADKVEGLDAGADDYLVKPFSLMELAARLRALARRAVSAEPHLLEVADLRFDLQTLTATRNGHAIKLNPTTRRILKLLMQNTQRVVAREELEQHLWPNEPPGPDVLRAHMHTLRSAIDKGSDLKLLHTVHGTGYRLSARSELEP